MTTYYVSSAATNGYVVGNDANNGTSKATPWRSLNNINDNGWTWAAGDTVYINGDTYCSTGFILDDTITIIGEPGVRPIVTLRSVTAGNYGLQIVANGKTGTLRHLHLKAGSVNEALIDITSAGTSTLVIEDCKTEANVLHYQSNAAGSINILTITNCEAYSAALSTAGVCLFQYLATGAEITINGLALDITLAGTGATTLIYGACTTGTAGTVSITGVTGTVNGASITSGALTGIATSRVNGAVIEDCNLYLSATATGVTCTLYKIGSVAATHVLTSGYIRNNKGRVDSKGGLLIIAGADGGAYNGANGILIYGNDVRGPDDVTTLHGIMLGGNHFCHAYANRVRYTQIALIAKDSEDARFSQNVVDYCLSGGQAFRCKGATRGVFVGNLHIVRGAWNAYSVYVDDGVANSTDCVYDGNALYAYASATPQLYVVYLKDANQTVTFKCNNWYEPSGSVGFYDKGNTDTLAQWAAEAYVNGDVSFRFNPSTSANKWLMGRVSVAL
jgi:hypothetical protein